MPTVLLNIICCYFAVGAVAIFIINKRKPSAQNRERWIKYIFYLLVVVLTVLSIVYNHFFILAGLIVGIGFVEVALALTKATKRSLFFKAVALIAYSIIAGGFYLCSWKQPWKIILFVYAIVFTFDGFAQITGQLLGKRKIAPAISPDKTWAGVIGGFVMAIATGWLLMPWLAINNEKAIIMIITTVIGALLGDLLASLFKRKCGIKDYSRLIPGHGGVLDRFDSFIMAGFLFTLVDWVNR